MTDYEPLAAQGTPPRVETNPRVATDAGRSLGTDTTTPAGDFPTRRSLRASAEPVFAMDAALPIPSPLGDPVVANAPAVAPAAAAATPFTSRRAAREAAASVPPIPTPLAEQVAQGPFGGYTFSHSTVTAPRIEEPTVAAPFGTFGAAATEAAAPASRRRTLFRRSRAAGSSPRSRTARPVRKQLSAAGAMLLIPGILAPFTFPAFAADNSYEAAIDSASDVAGQSLEVDSTALASVAIGEERESYEATSAAQQRVIYRDALRQRNLTAYLSSGAREMGDDYPWPGELTNDQGGGLSPLNYYYRECVDFVVWRLNRDQGYTKAPFKWVWSNLTPGLGSARYWKSQWQKKGWPISETPQVGWVAWFPGQNHVAYVSGVLADGSVAIEEYNWGPSTYGQRIIQASDAIYLSPPQG